MNNFKAQKELSTIYLFIRIEVLSRAHELNVLNHNIMSTSH
jgi:hypothetical protein